MILEPLRRFQNTYSRDSPYVKGEKFRLKPRWQICQRGNYRFAFVMRRAGCKLAASDKHIHTSSDCCESTRAGVSGQTKPVGASYQPEVLRAKGAPGAIDTPRRITITNRKRIRHSPARVLPRLIERLYAASLAIIAAAQIGRKYVSREPRIISARYRYV